MRIVQVLAGLWPGGAERLVLNLSRWLQEHGHEMVVLNIYHDSTLQPDFEQAGIPVNHLRLTPVLSQWYPHTLVRFLKGFGAEVVHCHDTAWRKAAQACRWARVPCVWTLHGYLRDWMDEGRGWMQSCARHTAFLVGVEPKVQQLIQQTLGLPEGQVVYVPNGVPDLYQLSPEPVEWGVPIPKDAPVVGMVSRLSAVKDPQTLIRAIAIVKQKIPTVQLVFVGTGELEEAMRGWIEDLGLQGCVHLLGLRRDVAQILHALDVFVLSSHSEGMSLAILEAMSAQRPIVATDVGGNSLLLDGGRCGVVVPPRDPHALAEAILELLTNREKAQQLAHNARQRFLEHFTIDAMGKRYLQVYEKAIEEFRRG